MLADIHIVLFETSHAGNIGASARAMKNMGLSRLRLVNPKEFPSPEATARASGADDVLQQAAIFPSLPTAIADTSLIIGTTARDRRLMGPTLDPPAMAKRVLAHLQQGLGKVAILFGRENNGLSNTELEACHYLVQIPANPEYSSLNLGAAVQVLSYELNMAMRSQIGILDPVEHDSPIATQDKVEGLYQQVETLLRRVEFIDTQRPTVLKRRIKRLLNRVQLEEQEVQFIRGILTAIERKLM